MPSLSDALHILSESTGTPWTRMDFFQAVIDNTLPLRATVPAEHYVVDNMGEADFDAGFQALEFRRLALLTGHAIKNLALNGDAETRDVALASGDPGFMTWPEIKAYRERSKRPDFMGESVFMFSQSVKVTDDSCRVPPETIEELRALKASNPSQRASAGVGTAGTTQHFIKRNSLDGPIEAAIKRGGSTASGIVWVNLRELALEGMPPFTGLVEGEVLHFTDDKNKPDTLKKSALKMRLVKHRRTRG